MTATTKPAAYTLSLQGRDWSFTPAAVDALRLTGQSPIMVAAILGSGAVTLAAGLTEVTGITPAKLLVTRHGRKVNVDVARAAQPQRGRSI